jgi:hypothetical protein
MSSFIVSLFENIIKVLYHIHKFLFMRQCTDEISLSDYANKLEFPVKFRVIHIRTLPQSIRFKLKIQRFCVR